MLERTQLSPLIDFVIETIYPRRTLALADNVFYAEHNRGGELISSKTVPGEMVTPRLQNLVIERLDSMIAVKSPSQLRISFRPSQAFAARKNEPRRERRERN